MEMKDIKGWQGLYQATTDGKVWSIRSKQFLKPFANKAGYYQVRLYDSKNDRVQQLQVSHVIYEAFKGSVPKGYDIHHLNGRRNVNNIENLVLMSKHEHMRMHWLGNQYAKGRIVSEQTIKRIKQGIKEYWRKKRGEI